MRGLRNKRYPRKVVLPIPIAILGGSASNDVVSRLSLHRYVVNALSAAVGDGYEMVFTAQPRGLVGANIIISWLQNAVEELPVFF